MKASVLVLEKQKMCFNFTVQLPNTILEEKTPDTNGSSIQKKNPMQRMQFIRGYHFMQCHAMLFDSKAKIKHGRPKPDFRSHHHLSIMPLPSQTFLPQRQIPQPSNHQAASHCLRRLASLGPMSGLPLRFPSGRFPPIIPIEGSIGPGLG